MRNPFKRKATEFVVSEPAHNEILYQEGSQAAMRMIINKEMIVLEATALLFGKIECNVPNSFADGFLDRVDRYRIAYHHNEAKRQRKARGSQ